MDDDSDSIESIIRFIETHKPNQIKTFLNIQEVKDELETIKKSIIDDLEIHQYDYDEIEEHPDIQNILNYIDLLDDPANNYAERLANYNAERVNLMTRRQIKTLQTRRKPFRVSNKKRTMGGCRSICSFCIASKNGRCKRRHFFPGYCKRFIGI